jgi:hypothetical protein
LPVDLLAAERKRRILAITAVRSHLSAEAKRNVRLVAEPDAGDDVWSGVWRSFRAWAVGAWCRDPWPCERPAPWLP